MPESYLRDVDVTLHHGDALEVLRTLLVARQLGRCAIGVELNERYAAMTKARLAQQSLFADVPA